MESFGAWGLVPPLLTIVLAFATKDVIVSLFLGTFSGVLIMAGGNPFAAVLDLTDLLVKSLTDAWNMRIFLFCGLLGALVGLLAKTGSALSFGNWAAGGIKDRRGGTVAAWIFGLVIFIDDYFSSLTVGTVMRPLTDKHGVSRAKLSYILDSTAAPVCIMAPISSWVVYTMSIMKDGPGFDKLGMSEFNLFIRAIPYNLYAILAVLMTFLVAFLARDFGPMAASERRAREGKGLFDAQKYGEAPGEIAAVSNSRAKPVDMIFPIAFLVAAALAFFPLVTWMGAVGPGEGQFPDLAAAVAGIPLGQAFNDTDASKALIYTIVVTLVVTYIFYVARGLLTIKTSAEAIQDGIKSMVPALIILALAWTIGGIIKNGPADGGMALNVWLSKVVVDGGFPLWLLPVVVFLFSCLISFSTGTSWGTFAIMVPIAMGLSSSLAEAAGLSGAALVNAVLVSVGAVLGGAVFGDHASPISDTTILSGTGAGCPHLEHVTTQMPYAVFVAVAALVGHIAAGLALSPAAGFAAAGAVFALGLVVLPKVWSGSR